MFRRLPWFLLLVHCLKSERKQGMSTNVFTGYKRETLGCQLKVTRVKGHREEKKTPIVDVSSVRPFSEPTCFTTHADAVLLVLSRVGYYDMKASAWRVREACECATRSLWSWRVDSIDPPIDWLLSWFWAAGVATVLWPKRCPNTERTQSVHWSEMRKIQVSVQSVNVGTYFQLLGEATYHPRRYFAYLRSNSQVWQKQLDGDFRPRAMYALTRSVYS